MLGWAQTFTFRVISFLLLAAVSNEAVNAWAADDAAKEGEPKEVKTGEKKKPLSVYDIHAARDGAILGAGTLLSLYPAMNGYHFIHIQTDPNPKNLIPWDQNFIYFRNVFLDNLSDVTVVISVAAPPILDIFDVGWTRVLYEDIFVYAQTMVLNSALSAFFKYTTQRPIPRVYAGDAELKDSARGYEGFYSGHVSTTMCALSAMAVTLDLRHDAGWWPWLIVAGVGTTVAIERVQAGEHFPTQVLAGAVMGPIVGTIIPWEHRRLEAGKAAVTLQPAPDGAALAWTKRF